MTSDELISREEVLARLPAKRANTLLFLIESRTAQIAARSRLEFSFTEKAVWERDLAFLEAFALGHAPPLRPTIQHLERYALEWAPLVPSNPRLKAALTHAVSQKYNFTYQIVPNIRAALGLVGLYLLSRQSLNFTVTVMVVLAAINVSLLLLLSLLAFPHVQLDNLLYVNLPFFNGQTIKPQMLQQVFGVSLMLYFGHVYVGECAKLILPRDKSASSLIWGSVAGTAFLTVLFCIWVLAVNGAIAPFVLASQAGTVLEPLAEQVGSIAKVLGSVLVALLLGMAWLRSSSLLINLSRAAGEPARRRTDHLHHHCWRSPEDG